MPLRVLALCGFTQNSFIYSKQLGAVRKTCKDVEFVFLEPPIVVEKADLPWSSNLDQFGSNATTDEAAQTPETTPRAWWTTANERKTYKRFDETVAYLHDFLAKNEPFDGVMGFSQGAGMAALLSALLEKPDLHPNFPSEPKLQKFKFAIFVGGFLPEAESHDFKPYFPLPATLPTLHVSGKNDTLITIERSQTLVDACENSRLELHDGGHYTPSKASWRHFFNAYISSFAPDGSQGDVPAVNSFGPGSTANTGTNTPINPKGGDGTPRSQTPSRQVEGAQ